MKPSAILFDLDGTLVDTAPDFASVLNRLRQRHDLPALPFERVREQVSHGAKAVVQLGFAEKYALDSTIMETLKQEFLDDYARHLADESRLFTGMADVLDEIRQNDIPWGVVTNKASCYTIPLLDALGVLPQAGSIICPDMVTRSKPDPEGLLRACTELGVSPDTAIYVGDHLRDIQAGHNAGMTTVAVSYGYLRPDDDPTTWQAHHLVHSVDEFGALLRSL